jgi:hypothetical protein
LRDEQIAVCNGVLTLRVAFFSGDERAVLTTSEEDSTESTANSASASAANRNAEERTIEEQSVEHRTDERRVSASRSEERIVVTIAGESFELSRSAATSLQDAVGDALTERREFFRTAATHREDGCYVVSRRGADSAGNEKVFGSFADARALFERLPREFGAAEVGRTGITGSRRHLLVRHFAEHPAFDCRITSQNPLTAVKERPESGDSGAAERAERDDSPATADAG